MKHSTLCFPVLLIAVLSSCGAQYDLSLRPSGAADVSVSARLEPHTLALLRNVSGLSGTEAAKSTILDARGLNEALRKTPGVSASALRNPDVKSVTGGFTIGQIGAFLSAPLAKDGTAATRFVRYEPSAVKGSTAGKISVTFDRSRAPEMVKALSPEVVDYLNALMAPIVTGEALSAKDYLDAVKVMYGEGVSSEIAAARILFDIAVPGPVTAAQGGSFSGKVAHFSIALVDLFVLEKPISLGIVWK